MREGLYYKRRYSTVNTKWLNTGASKTLWEKLPCRPWEGKREDIRPHSSTGESTPPHNDPTMSTRGKGKVRENGTSTLLQRKKTSSFHRRRRKRSSKSSSPRRSRPVEASTGGTCENRGVHGTRGGSRTAARCVRTAKKKENWGLPSTLLLATATIVCV